MNKKYIISFLIFIISIILIYVYSFYGTLSLKTNANGVNCKIKKKGFIINEEFQTKLRPGKYKITLQKNGYKPAEKDIKIGLFKKTVTEIELTPLPEKVLDLSVKDPAISVDGNEVYYYDITNTKLAKYKIKENMSIFLSNEITQTVNNIYWSPDRKSAIIFVRDTKGEKANLFNLQNNELKALDKNISRPITWSPDSKHIAYNYLSNTVSSLNISEPDGKNWQKVIDINNLQNIFWHGEKKITYTLITSDDNPILPAYELSLDIKKVKEVPDIIDIKFLNTKLGTIPFMINTQSLNLFYIKDNNPTATNIKPTLENTVVNPDLNKLYYVDYNSNKARLIAYSLQSKSEKAYELPDKNIYNLLISPENSSLFFTDSDNSLFIMGLPKI